MCEALHLSKSYLYTQPIVISAIKEFIQRTRSKTRALRFHQREEELMQEVLKAIQELQIRKQQLSVSAIAKLVHLSSRGLYYYPRVRAILVDIAEKRRHIEIQSNE